MRKLIVKMSMSLDGFVSGPNRDGKWIFRASDEESQAWSVASAAQAGIHAMGHNTFRDMAAYWPTAQGPFAPVMNAIPKVVFARGGLAPGDVTAKSDVDPEVMRSWMHPRVATGDLAEEIAKLKQEPGKDIVAHGGAAFVQSLIEQDLVDEYRLAIHPVALGSGLPIFSKVDALRDLELVELKRFPKGIVAHVYARAKR